MTENEILEYIDNNGYILITDYPMTTKDEASLFKSLNKAIENNTLDTWKNTKGKLIKLKFLTTINELEDNLVYKFEYLTKKNKK